MDAKYKMIVSDTNTNH